MKANRKKSGKHSVKYSGKVSTGRASHTGKGFKAMKTAKAAKAATSAKSAKEDKAAKSAKSSKSAKSVKSAKTAGHDYLYSVRGNHIEKNRMTSEDTRTGTVFRTPEELMEERAGFGTDVMREIAHIRNSLSKTSIEKELKKGRRDLRSITLVTIDSEETKDVDDAVSIERRENGYLLGVHIADVSHYVKENSALDREAYKRGTSIYLADKVLPMLPQKLSNGICSLNVGEDRFAMSVMMDIDTKGNITGYEIFESIINVKYKITYEQIYALMEGDTEKYSQQEMQKQFREHTEELWLMRELAALRYYVRHKRGAIDFEIPETHIITDKDGDVTGIEAYKSTFANNIIEEFMLAANETVAMHFAAMNAPFIYRVHGSPDIEKIMALSSAVRSMGYTLRTYTGSRQRHGYITASAVQDLLKAVKGKTAEPVISSLALRAMQKAEYSHKNEGHFGLAAEYYTHFTSPIRRYPDLFIHRVIKCILRGSMPPDKRAALRDFAEAAAPHCSETEREAENAERLYTDMLAAKYMSGHIGDIFEGTVCNITSFGIFVRLDNSAEGLVFYNSMPEYMIFDDKKMTAIGERSNIKIAVGDRVSVKVVNCNIRMGQIEFHFAK